MAGNTAWSRSFRKWPTLTAASAVIALRRESGCTRESYLDIAIEKMRALGSNSVVSRFPLWNLPV